MGWALGDRLVRLLRSQFALLRDGLTGSGSDGGEGAGAGSVLSPFDGGSAAGSDRVVSTTTHAAQVIEVGHG